MNRADRSLSSSAQSAPDTALPSALVARLRDRAQLTMRPSKSLLTVAADALEAAERRNAALEYRHREAESQLEAAVEEERDRNAELERRLREVERWCDKADSMTGDLGAALMRGCAKEVRAALRERKEPGT